MSGDVKACWAKWNATFDLANSAKQYIEGNSCIADMAQGITNYYESNFYYSSSHILFKNRFQSTYNATSAMPKGFTVNEIRFAIST